MTIFKEIWTSFLHLVYPPLCLHCKESIDTGHLPLCRNCLALLELLELKERCPRCFSTDYSPHKRLCHDCLKRPPLLKGVTQCFDYMGPAKTLIHHLKYHGLSHLAKGCSGYLALQFLEMGWDMPDMIVPVPITFNKFLERGFNQSELLASHLGELIKCPVENVLFRKSGEYSQTSLDRNQRMSWEGLTLELKKESLLEDKSILLVDDVYTTGTTLRKCAEVLTQKSPKAIYGITFCRTL